MPEPANYAEDGGRVARNPGPGDHELEQIRRAVKGLRFGEVRVVVQDGVIVQIDRVEKLRLR